jgi:TRAP-type mannitol/chloroaromatic compound transport system substrate-binding protein
MSEDTTTPRRRGLLKAAAVGAAGTAVLATPNVSRAQTVTMRFQSTWPQRDIFHEFAQDYVNRVNAMAGGRLRLELLAAGAVVGAFQLLDAVNAGTLDGGHGVSAYWFGKNKAFSLFGTTPPGSATPTSSSAGSTTAAARPCTRSCWRTS